MSLTTTMRLTPADNYENIERKRSLMKCPDGCGFAAEHEAHFALYHDNAKCNARKRHTTTRSTVERTIQEITEHIDSCCYGDTDEDTQCGACTAAHSSLQALDNFLSELDEKRGSR